MIDVIRALLALSLMVGPAWGQDRSDWFKSLKQPGGGASCCDVSDCKRTEAKWQGEGWTAMSRLTDKGWISIPNDKVLQQPKSLDGDAYLCEGRNGAVYCFVPPDIGS